MKTYSECKTEIAKQYGYLTWSELKEGENNQNLDGFNEEVAKLYAQQVAEEVRQRCSGNAKINAKDLENWPWVNVDKDSILNTKIILP